MGAQKRKASAAAAEEGTPAGKRTRRFGLYEEYKGKKIPEPRVPRAKVTKGFKAISWNVGGLRALLEKRSKDLKKLVQEEKPAVLGILEHKLQEGEHVEAATRRLQELLPQYAPAVFSCSKVTKGYAGACVLLEKEVAQSAKVRAVKLEKGSDEGRTLCVELPRLFVVVCYVVNSGDGLKRLRERLNQWDTTFRSYLKGLARRKPVLLLGDLNVAHRDLDIWNLEAPHVPKSSTTTFEERESFGKLLELGFVDGFAHQHPEVKGAFTYWSVRGRNRQPNRGLRLDYAVVSAGVTGAGKGGVRLADAFHLPGLAPGGDHCPVGATLVGV